MFILEIKTCRIMIKVKLKSTTILKLNLKLKQLRSQSCGQPHFFFTNKIEKYTDSLLLCAKETETVSRR